MSTPLIEETWAPSEGEQHEVFDRGLPRLREMMFHPKLCAGVQWKVAIEGDMEHVRLMARFCELDEEVQEHLLSLKVGSVDSALAGNRFLSEKSQEEILWRGESDACLTLLGNGTLSRRLQEKAAREGTKQVRWWLCRNERLSEPLQVILASDPDGAIRAGIAKREDVCRRAQEILAGDTSEGVLSTLAGNTAVDQDILVQLSWNPHRWVQRSASRNVSLSYSPEMAVSFLERYFSAAVAEVRESTDTEMWDALAPQWKGSAAELLHAIAELS